jgi:hypothetical protein
LQHRATVEEQCYPQQEIVRALAVTGFRKIEVVTASDAGMTSAIGFGRVFFASLSQE